MQKITINLDGNLQGVPIDELRELTQNGSVDASVLIYVDGEIWNLDDVLRQSNDESINREVTFQTSKDCSYKSNVPATLDPLAVSSINVELNSEEKKASLSQFQGKANAENLKNGTRLLIEGIGSRGSGLKGLLIDGVRRLCSGSNGLVFGLKTLDSPVTSSTNVELNGEGKNFVFSRFQVKAIAGNLKKETQRLIDATRSIPIPYNRSPKKETLTLTDATCSVPVPYDHSSQKRVLTPIDVARRFCSDFKGLVLGSTMEQSNNNHARRFFNLLLRGVAILSGCVLAIGIALHNWDLSDTKVRELIHKGDVEFERAVDLVINDESVDREELEPLFQKANEYWKKAETKGRGIYAGKAARRLGDSYYYGTGFERNFERAAEEYRKGAELGDDFAIWNWAISLYNGYGVNKDQRAALEFLHKAVEKQNASAARMLAFIYQDGCEGVNFSKDQNKADELFRKAFEWAKSSSTFDEMLSSDDRALNEVTLGRCLYSGLGTQKDVGSALDCFRRAKRGSACYEIGNAYYNGENVSQDYREAVSWFKRAVLLGYPAAYSMLGVCYENGNGVEKCIPEAVKWYEQGASLKNGYSCGQLGTIYLNGAEGGLQKNVVEAVKWYEQGASLENGYCCRQLGVIYKNGESGVEKNITEAIRLFQKGVEFQDGYCCFQLGQIYSHNEDGVEKNVDEALKWLRKGVELQDSFSIGMMGCGYYDGSLFETDYVEAVKWFRKSAELQNSGACYLLGVCYENGQGVETDKKEALKWYQKSLELGYAESTAFEAVERLTPASPSKAAKLLDETLRNLEEQYWTSAFDYSILNEDKWKYNDVKSNFDSFAKAVCAIDLNVNEYENLPSEVRDDFIKYKNTVVNLADLFNRYSYSGWKTAGVGIATVIGGVLGAAMNDDENASTSDKLDGAATGATLAHQAATSGYESQITNIEKLANYCIEARDKLTQTISSVTNGNSSKSDSNNSKGSSIYDKIKKKLSEMNYGSVEICRAIA